MNYTVNLGCWGSIFAVPTDIVDKYIKIAGSAQLKVLLYILRHSGESFDIDSIAQYLNMGTFDVKDCIEFWTSFNILAINDNVISPAPIKKAEKTAPIVSEIKTAAPSIKKAEPAAAASAPLQPPVNNKTAHNSADAAKPQKTETAVKNESDVVAARPLRPDPIYVAKRINEDKEIASLLNEAQYILGRPVSPNENAGMIMLHDNDGLPCEVIIMLLSYGVSNQKGMRQIEAMGAAWAREGILTLEQADEKIREMEESKESYRKVQSILGLEFRKPSKNEEENYNRWINEWKFSDEVIKEAYDICINAKGKYIPNYVNTILSRWHQNNIKTIEQVRTERSKNSYKNNNSNTNSTNNTDNSRKSSFDIQDLNGLSMFND